MTTQTAAVVGSVDTAKPRQRTVEQQQRLWGWIFLSPWLVGFAVFTAFPMIASLIFSFTDFTIGQDIHFVGLTNWKLMFSDPITLGSLGVTLKFALYLLPISILFPLVIATMLNSKTLYAKPFFRLFFYMPYIIPAISGIFVWQGFLNSKTGWLDLFLNKALGINPVPNWLEPPYLNTGLVLIGLWGVGNAMLTMMASMQGVPTELYEAAKVDGAGAWHSWRNITLPMISPVIFYNLVLTSIGLMQYFTVPYVLTNNTRSDPNLNFINLHLYRTAFQYNQMGFASALAWFMFLIGLAITIALFASARRWVYYSAGD